MFQKEVAQRITAQPGTEHYGRLSVLTQWRAQPKILFDVNRSAFVPPPSVTSAIVRLEPRDEPLAPARLQTLEAVTAAAFGQRRKMLRQSLKPLGGEALAERAGIDPTARPEDLTIEQFAALARSLAWTRLNPAAIARIHLRASVPTGLGTRNGTSRTGCLEHRRRHHVAGGRVLWRGVDRALSRKSWLALAADRLCHTVSGRRGAFCCATAAPIQPNMR